MTRLPPAVPKEEAPRHVAVIMDGNGRWAKQQGKPRSFGHRAGVRAAKKAIKACHRNGVEALTVFAFSQENWQRPEKEVSLLMQLFLGTLSRELDALDRNGARLRFIGDHGDFSRELRELMRASEKRTASNTELALTVAVGYGGKWDVVQAAQQCTDAGLPLTVENIDQRLATAHAPPVDLLIRTGGERRLSNFLLWQLAYSELYFTDTLWPDFGEEEFDQALRWYASRERRYGKVSEAA